MGTRNPGFGYSQFCGKMGVEDKLNKVFLHFFAIFDDFSKWSELKYGHKFGKKMKKTLFNLPSTHFSANSGYTRKPDMWYLFRH